MRLLIIPKINFLGCLSFCILEQWNDTYNSASGSTIYHFGYGKILYAENPPHVLPQGCFEMGLMPFSGNGIVEVTDAKTTCAG